ncbi:beta-galactosidase GalB [Microbulbifer pacificus]|uniref:beta-galactosidase GalB n=1 Tax=Microbulbifer pacificus TaxID=407164 RepID=UPI000CF439C2|nr:beta-galactosidase GalB [Microbulbifer pacificus]
MFRLRYFLSLVALGGVAFAYLTFFPADLSLVESASPEYSEHRQRLPLRNGWRFFKYESAEVADALIYDVRPKVTDDEDGKAADAMPTAAEDTPQADRQVLKPWILPSANDFIRNPQRRFERPAGSPGSDFPFTRADFDDGDWQPVSLPHDWAIHGPFFAGEYAPVGGGMGRLPSPGIAWYRNKLDIPAADAGKQIYLDVDGAMSYAMVWINGELAGGWPYGYASWRVDLTPYLDFGGVNQLAIRLDNPPASSRWYPGGGLYRNVWLTKTNPVHIAQWGTFVTTPSVSAEAAQVEMTIAVDNNSAQAVAVRASTDIYALDINGAPRGPKVASTQAAEQPVPSGGKAIFNMAARVREPQLWGPPPTQKPNRYVAITKLLNGDGEVVDRYETPFGIREIRFDAERGLFVNGERIEIRGANQHHDLGALGAAFNRRAAERQLEVLREAGVNAIRMAHNPPDPQLLELTDRMGFLVVNEIFDVWERKKTPLDFHLIFPDWHEADLRAFIRRDRNHPSVIMWSLGNEVGEQYTGEAGAAVASRLHDVAKEEDPTRPSTVSMNYAKPHMPLPGVMDAISLNYQGEGIRDAPAYQGLQGIRTSPLYPDFQKQFPQKVILSSENAAAVSSRGEYLFPVEEGISAPVADGRGGDPGSQQVSAYELYTAPFGSSADKVFRSLEQHPYVAGGFVWSGWDYLGEPTPYYGARSSYFGIVDLAGFKKDRFYLYQSQWRPELPMAHILPHWTWPERNGEVTPVHVFTSGDEAELFLNGRSLGRKKKGEYEYRLRWDDVVYEPGELRVQAYKNGEAWAEDRVVTAGAAAVLAAETDRAQITADGDDLAFVTLQVLDAKGNPVPRAHNAVTFDLQGPGEIIATENGDPTSLVPFNALQRDTFNGLCLVVVRSQAGREGEITVTASSPGLESATAKIVTTL